MEWEHLRKVITEEASNLQRTAAALTMVGPHAAPATVSLLAGEAGASIVAIEDALELALPKESKVTRPIQHARNKTRSR